MYERTYGHILEDEVEIVSIRATLRTPLPRRAAQYLPPANGQAEPKPGTHRAYSFSAGQWLNFALLERSRLAIDRVIAGPAIILEETSTTYLDADFEARVDGSGCLFITDKAGG